MLTLLFAVSSVDAQTFEVMAERFEACPKAEMMRIGPMMLRLAKAFAPKKDLDEMGKEGLMFLDRVKSMTILDLSECSEQDKSAFRKTMQAWHPTNFELVEMGDAADENSQMRSFFRMGEKKRCEMLMIDLKEAQCILIEGDMDAEFMKQIAGEHEPR